MDPERAHTPHPCRACQHGIDLIATAKRDGRFGPDDSRDISPHTHPPAHTAKPAPRPIGSLTYELDDSATSGRLAERDYREQLDDNIRKGRRLDSIRIRKGREG